VESIDIGELRKKAERGNVAAQSILGICYLDGIDVKTDYAEAYHFLSLAAKRGASRAQFNLARMLANGLGVPRDPSRALSL